TFDLEVESSVLSEANALRIRLTNDAYSEGVGDRNLRVISAEIDGVTYPATEFQFRRSGQAVDGPTGLLATNGDVAILAAPEGVWINSIAPTVNSVEPESNAPSVATSCTAGQLTLSGFANGVIALTKADQ